MLDPVIKTIVVQCDQEKAFSLFVNKMDTWWPLDKFTVSAMGGKPAKSIRVDASEGGEIVEIGSDNSESLWGTINSIVPNESFNMNFHIPQPGEVVSERSIVEIKFIEMSKEETKIELKQNNWEAFGDRAKDMQGGYGGGWNMILNEFESACTG